MYTPWRCESCGYHWQERSPFITYDECPKCDSDCIGHGEVVEEPWEDWEQYNIYDEEDQDEK